MGTETFISSSLINFLISIDKRKVPGGDGNYTFFILKACTVIDKRKVPGGDGNDIVYPYSTALFIDKRKVPGGDGNLFH